MTTRADASVGPARWSASPVAPDAFPNPRVILSLYRRYDVQGGAGVEAEPGLVPSHWKDRSSKFDVRIDDGDAQTRRRAARKVQGMAVRACRAPHGDA